jgi:phosphotriesterase-related protein
MAEVMTVLGPVPSTDLGITLPHEHLLLDLSILWSEPLDPARAVLVDAPIEPANRALLLSDPYHCRTNMTLDDVDLAVAEVARFAALGGCTIVDLSTRNIGPYPVQLAKIARGAGVHIVAGTGFYVRRAHPAWVAAADEEDLAAHMIGELTEGFAGAGIRAGIIGEIGSSSPIHPDEERSMCISPSSRARGIACSICWRGRGSIHAMWRSATWTKQGIWPTSGT